MGMGKAKTFFCASAYFYMCCRTHRCSHNHDADLPQVFSWDNTLRGSQSSQSILSPPLFRMFAVLSLLLLSLLHLLQASPEQALQASNVEVIVPVQQNGGILLAQLKSLWF